MELKACLKKARVHGVEVVVNSHVGTKMEEVNGTYLQWKEEAAMQCKAEKQQAEEAWRAEEAHRVASSMLFKPTGLLGGATVADKGKGKDHPLVHAPNTHMSVTQHKVSSRSPCHYLEQEESGLVAHMVKCALCEMNNWCCIGILGRTCNECTKAKAKCNKSLGQMGGERE